MIRSPLVTFFGGLLFFLITNRAHAIQLDYESIPKRVQSSHPALKAARFQIAEAEGRLTQSGRRANPEVGFEFQHDPKWREGGFTLSFDQEFPLTARLREEKKLSQQKVEIANLEVKEAERQLILQAQLLAIELYIRREMMRNSEQQSRIRQDAAEFMNQNAQRGEASPLDLIQVELEASEKGIETQQTKLLISKIELELKRLLGIKPQESLELTGTLKMPSFQSLKKLKWEGTSHHLRSIAQAKILEAETDLKIAQSKKIQDIKAGLFTSVEREEDQGLENKGMVGFRISVPLPLWNKNQGEVQEKTASLQRRKAELEAVEQEILHQKSSSLEIMKQQAALWHRIETEMLPKAQNHIQKLEEAWKQGQVELSIIHKAREQWSLLKSNQLESLKEFHQAYAEFLSLSESP